VICYRNESALIVVVVRIEELGEDMGLREGSFFSTELADA
jgi:hypothetical protein